MTDSSSYDLTDTLILVTYFFVLSILAIYGWHRYYLVYLYMKNKGNVPKPLPELTVLPPVTIQLPIFNEMYVADRLIDAVCEMDYPRELLEIQVLDDSTDETTEIAELAVRRHAARGVEHPILHRVDRRGYKAGALEAGLAVASGEFIAIFDADFIPPSDFLKRTLPYFTGREGRDGPGALGPHQPGLLAPHARSSRSCSTRISSSSTAAATARGCFFNFNGTAGIWRREAIDDGGGWQHDTLTEDLDLELPRAAEGLAVRVPAGRRVAGRSAGRDELVQVAAAPLGEGVDSDRA